VTCARTRPASALIGGSLLCAEPLRALLNAEQHLALHHQRAGLHHEHAKARPAAAPLIAIRLTTVPFRPALYDTFAVITRRAARISPGMRELLTDLAAHMQGVASDFDRSR
jgi:hypothetical protein